MSAARKLRPLDSPVKRVTIIDVNEERALRMKNLNDAPEDAAVRKAQTWKPTAQPGKSILRGKANDTTEEAQECKFPGIDGFIHQGGYMIDRVVTVVDILSKPLKRQSCPGKRLIQKRTQGRSSTRLRS